MTQSLPVLLVPGLLCSARLYAPQITALWPYGPVTVADHRRDGRYRGGRRAHLARGAAALRARRAFLWRLHRLRDHAAGGRARRQARAARHAGAAGHAGADARRAMPSSPWRRRAGSPKWSTRFTRASCTRTGAAKRRCSGVVDAMVAETGPEAFVRQEKAIISRPDSRPLLPASNARRWCWSAMPTN